MKKNMGTLDKTLRLLADAVIAILYFTHVLSGTWGLVTGVLAIVFLLTSLVSFCPLYALFGMHTCTTKNEILYSKIAGTTFNAFRQSHKKAAGL